MAKKGEIVTLNLEFYPEIVNKNGRKYTQKAYDEVIDLIRKRVLSSKSNEILYVSYSQGFNPKTDIDIKDCIGFAKAINTDTVPPTLDIKLWRDIKDAELDVMCLSPVTIVPGVVQHAGIIDIMGKLVGLMYHPKTTSSWYNIKKED